MIATKGISNGTALYISNVEDLMAGLCWIIVQHMKWATEAELSKAGVSRA